MGALAAGTVLQNRYEIEGLAGQGAMGTVYKALDRRLRDHRVAIKELARRKDAHDWERAVKAFAREATILSGLTHPALVRVSDSFEEDGAAYLVMDWVEGETLSPRIGHCSVPEVLDWSEQIASALSYLHGSGILMGDLKPANLMLDGGRIRLIDFGLARIFSSETATATTSSLGIGTPGYASVEQYSGQVCDARADIYSFGATLYALLSGQAPPPSPDLAFNNKVLPRLENVPTAVEAAIAAMMILDKAKRPGTVAEVLPLLRGESPQPAPKRRSLLAIGVAVVGVAGLLWVGRAAVPQEPTRTVLFDRYVPFRQLVFSPQGQWLVGAQSVGYKEPRGKLLVWDAKTSSALQTLEGPQGDLIAAAFSRDGSRIVGAGTHGDIRVWDSGTWSEVPDQALQLQGSDNWLADLALSPDGHTVALLACPQYRPTEWPDNSLSHPQIWSLDTHQRIATLDTVGARTVAFSPDGRTLATAGKEVKLWDTSTWQLRRELVGHGAPVNALAFSDDGVLATGSEDRSIILWDSMTGQPSVHLTGTGDAVEALAFAHKEPVLVSGDYHDLRFWHYKTSSTASKVVPVDDGPSTVAVDTDDRTVATSGHAKVILWRWPRALP